MKKENKETILQLGVNMRISCLRPDLFPVCEATLETLFYLLYPVITDSSLLQKLNFPARVSVVMESTLRGKVQSATHGVTFNSDTLTGQTNMRLTDCIRCTKSI